MKNYCKKGCGDVFRPAPNAPKRNASGICKPCWDDPQRAARKKSDEPQKQENAPQITKHSNGKIKWKRWLNKNGRLHREGDLPASISFRHDGTKIEEIWAIDGRRHREGGKPAYVSWLDKDVLREQAWCKNGLRHRDDGNPAIVIFAADGKTPLIKEWWVNGARENPYGPIKVSFDAQGRVLSSDFEEAS